MLVFHVPEINVKLIVTALEEFDKEPTTNEELKGQSAEELKILWRINYDRFKRELRDQVVVQAVKNRIDEPAGSLMRLLLNMMNENSPWATVSCHFR